jgi:hypothetical protein
MSRPLPSYRLVRLVSAASFGGGDLGVIDAEKRLGYDLDVSRTILAWLSLRYLRLTSGFIIDLTRRVELAGCASRSGRTWGFSYRHLIEDMVTRWAFDCVRIRAAILLRLTRKKRFEATATFRVGRQLEIWRILSLQTVRLA